LKAVFITIGVLTIMAFYSTAKYNRGICCKFHSY